MSNVCEVHLNTRERLVPFLRRPRDAGGDQAARGPRTCFAQLTADQSSELESWMVKSPVEATLGQTWRLSALQPCGCR